MSWYDYDAARRIWQADPPFYALIMAAMYRADSPNTTLLRAAWPDVWDEVFARYHAPGGFLPGESPPAAASASARLERGGQT